MPSGVCAKLTSVPTTILRSAINSLRPSLDMITTSAATPARSCAPILLGLFPCDGPRDVVTLMPVLFSKSGKSSCKAAENPPEVRTLICANEVFGKQRHIAMKNSNRLPACPFFVISEKSSSNRANSRRTCVFQSQLLISFDYCFGAVQAKFAASFVVACASHNVLASRCVQ